MMMMMIYRWIDSCKNGCIMSAKCGKREETSVGLCQLHDDSCGGIVWILESRGKGSEGGGIRREKKGAGGLFYRPPALAVRLGFLANVAPTRCAWILLNRCSSSGFIEILVPNPTLRAARLMKDTRFEYKDS